MTRISSTALILYVLSVSLGCISPQDNGTPTSKACSSQSNEYSASLYPAATRTEGGIAFSVAYAVPACGALLSNVGDFPALDLSTSVQANWLPVSVPFGVVVTGWSVQLQKTSVTGSVTATMYDVDGVNAVGKVVGSQQKASARGNVQLTQDGLSDVVVPGHSLVISLHGGGSDGDFVIGYSVSTQ